MVFGLAACYRSSRMEFSKDEAEHWMGQACELALAAGLRDEVPVGAVFVRENTVVGAGSNRREETRRTVSHAEIVALEDYTRRFSQWRFPPGTSLFVTAEPCLMCTGALLWARVDNIYFGCSDPREAGLKRILPLVNSGVYDHRFSDIEGGFLADRCGELLRSYFRMKRQGDSRCAALLQNTPELRE